MIKYEHAEFLWNNPEVEMEHNIMEAETKEYNIGISGRIGDGLNLGK